MLGNHLDCCHFFGSFEVPEGEAIVCSCACHRSCPVAKKKSGIEAELLAACTCPGGVQLRRNQELLTERDLARIAQIREAARQDWAASDEAARKEKVKQRLVQAYEAAAAQAAGRPLEDHLPMENPRELPMENPREVMYLFANRLADLGTEEEAAHLLGLTADQVTAARNAAREFHLRRIVEHLPERKRKRVEKRLRKMPWPPPS
jgi:hypothetical protein